MSPIKTVNQVTAGDNNLNFGISRMEDIHEKHNGKAKSPHRHNYYTVLLSIKAKGKHLIDFRSYSLSDRQIFFISPGQVHQVIEDKKSTGFSIVFSDQF